MFSEMGRQHSDNQRKKLVGCKLTKQELRLLEYYCRLNNVSKSEILKHETKPIIDPESESE